MVPKAPVAILDFSEILKYQKADTYHCLQFHQISRNSVRRFSVTSQNRFRTKRPPGGILGENWKIWHMHTIGLHAGNTCTKFQEDLTQTVEEIDFLLDKCEKRSPGRWRPSWIFSEIFQHPKVDPYYCLQSHQISINSMKRFPIGSRNLFWTIWSPAGLLGKNWKIRQTCTIGLHPWNKCTKFRQDPIQTVGGDRFFVGQRWKTVPWPLVVILNFFGNF